MRYPETNSTLYTKTDKAARSVLPREIFRAFRAARVARTAQTIRAAKAAKEAQARRLQKEEFPGSFYLFSSLVFVCVLLQSV